MLRLCDNLCDATTVLRLIENGGEERVAQSCRLPMTFSFVMQVITMQDHFEISHFIAYQMPVHCKKAGECRSKVVIICQADRRPVEFDTLRINELNVESTRNVNALPLETA